MINIAELLKDAPKGMKLYSPLFGEVEFSHVTNSRNMVIYVSTPQGFKPFTSDGNAIVEYMKGVMMASQECLLFPSKDCRTWEGWKLPKPHYDIANFQPFDKVLVRFCNGANWCCALFSHYCTRGNCHFVCSGGSVTQCIPFNEETKHLLGTIDMCPEEYINW